MIIRKSFARKSLIPILASALILPCAVSAYGAEADNPLSLSLEAGVRYDDNIIVDAQDLASRVADESALFRGAVGYKIGSGGDTYLKPEYSFSQTLHQDATQFDLQIHGLSLDGGTKLGNLNLGATYRYSYVRLGRENFLDIHSLRPNLRFRAASKFFVTLAYEYQQQDFKQLALDGRDAHRNSASVNGFYSLGKGKSISASYRVMRHITDDTVLRYWAHVITARVRFPFEIAGREFAFRGRYRYRMKDFMNFDPDIGAKRSDNRHSLRARLETPLFAKLTARIQYEYVDSSSNLASIDYKEQVVTFSIAWKM